MDFKAYDDDKDFDCIINNDYTIDPLRAFKVGTYSTYNETKGSYMSLPKKTVIQFHDVGLYTEYRVILKKTDFFGKRCRVKQNYLSGLYPWLK